MALFLSAVQAPPAALQVLVDRREDFLSSSGRVNSCEESAAQCLLLLTHHAVMSYCPMSDEIEVLASSENARFRGAFDAEEDGCFWVLASPLKDVKAPTLGSVLSTDVPDELWLLDSAKGGDGTDAVRWRTRAEVAGDLHEALRRDDELFLVNTREGSVLQAPMPHDGQVRLEITKRHRKWSRRDHINQIALLGQTALVNVHNRGAPSRVELLDLGTGSNTNLLSNVGRAAHGLALWHDCRSSTTYLVNLDSRNAGLGVCPLANDEQYRTVWMGPAGRFTKGLAVVGHVAYFGLSAASASLASRLKATVELVAIDLEKALDGRDDAVLWQRELPYPGLLNQIVSPQILELTNLPGKARPRRELVRNLDFSDTVNIEKANQPPAARAVPASAHSEAGMKLGRFASVKPQADAPERHPSGKEYFSPGWRVPEGGLKSAVTSKARGAPQSGSYHRPSPSAPEAASPSPDKPSIFDRQEDPRAQFTNSLFSVEERRGWSEFGIHLDAFRRIMIDAGTLASDDELVACAFAPGEATSDPIDLNHKRRPLLSAQSLNDIYRHRGAVESAAAFTRLVDNLATSEWWERAYAQEHNAVFVGRDAFMQKFKKDVHAIILRFSDRSGRNVWNFPWMAHFHDALEAIWRDLGLDPKLVIRAQLALMPPGSTIKMHVDNGGWVLGAHRIHVPLKTNDRTVFLSRCNGRMMRMPTVENVAFEINNKSPHAVFNRGSTGRIHLLMDIAEEPPDHVYQLAKGAQCDYNSLPDDCGEEVIAAQ